MGTNRYIKVREETNNEAEDLLATERLTETLKDFESTEDSYVARGPVHQALAIIEGVTNGLFLDGTEAAREYGFMLREAVQNLDAWFNAMDNIVGDPVITWSPTLMERAAKNVDRDRQAKPPLGE